MTISPLSCHVPLNSCSLGGSAGCTKQQKASQDSSVPIRDCLSRSCFFCHDLSAQNLEFFSPDLSGMPLQSIWGIVGTARSPFFAPASCSFPEAKGRHPSDPSLAAMRRFRKDFPQGSARFSKHNLETGCICVNLFSASSPQVLS